MMPTVAGHLGRWWRLEHPPDTGGGKTTAEYLGIPDRDSLLVCKGVCVCEREREQARERRETKRDFFFPLMWF